MFQYLTRFKFVKYVSIAAIILLVGFGFLRVLKGMHLFAYVDFFIALLLAFNLWLLLKKRHLVLASHILISFLIFLSLFLYATGGIEQTGNIPLLAMPLFTYFVLGKKGGGIWTGFYTFVLLVITVLFFTEVIANPYSAAVIRQTLIFYLLIVWVSYLFESLNFKSQRQIKQQADSLKAYNFELSRSVEEKTESIKQLRDNLEATIETEVQRKKTKDQIFFQQSQQTQILEMLSMVSDQWKEPLSYIASVLHNTRLIVKSDKLNAAYIEETLENIENTLEELSDIIDSFYLFYKPNYEKEYFFVHLSVKNVLMMMEKSFKHANVHLNLCLDDGLEIAGFKSEFEQVILNILSNGKRELEHKKVEHPWMEITVREDVIDDIVFANITIRDNALGIKEEDLPGLFSPQSQRHSMEDNNIGLYLSKEIIEGHMHGTITASNYEEMIDDELRIGMKFEIILPLVVRRG